MQETELVRLIRTWDAQVPASDHATSLLLVLQEIRCQLGVLAEALQKATESPITASPTTVSPLGAESRYLLLSAQLDQIYGLLSQMDSTIPPTQASSPSVPTTTESGPVEQNSGCAHEWREFGVAIEPLAKWCCLCGALKFRDRILVPAATTTPSTFPKPDSESSVAPSESTAPSLSKESGERL